MLWRRKAIEVIHFRQNLVGMRSNLELQKHVKDCRGRKMDGCMDDCTWLYRGAVFLCRNKVVVWRKAHVVKLHSHGAEKKKLSFVCLLICLMRERGILFASSFLKCLQWRGIRNGLWLEPEPGIQSRSAVCLAGAHHYCLAEFALRIRIRNWTWVLWASYSIG